MNIEQELLELIKSKLPEKEVGAIKEIMERNEQLVAENKAQKERLDMSKKNWDELMEERNSLSIENDKSRAKRDAVNAMEKDLKEKIAIAEEKARKIDIEKAQFEAGVCRETLGLLLKNTEVRKTYQRAIPTKSYDYNSGRVTGEYTNTVQETEVIIEE